MQQLNLTAFDTPVTRQERRAELNELTKVSGSSAVAMYVVLAVILLIVVMVGANIIATEAWLGLGALLLAVFIAAGIIVWWLFSFATNRARLRKFALDNNLEYIGNVRFAGEVVDIAGTPIEGALFNTGHSKTMSGGFKRDDGMLALNYYYTVGSGKNSRTYTWGVLRHKLPRKLPNVILDAKSNNSIFGSNLPESYAGGQKLELEGDFNNYFRVLVPEGYGRDALYFLTPELMAHLVDYGKGYEFEVVDDNLYIYSQGGFKFNEQTLPNIFQTIDFFAYQFSDNVARYADERVPNARTVNVVGAQGTRLKKRFAWVGIVFFIIFILLQLLPNILSFFLGDSY